MLRQGSTQGAPLLTVRHPKRWVASFSPAAQSVHSHRGLIVCSAFCSHPNGCQFTRAYLGFSRILSRAVMAALSCNHDLARTRSSTGFSSRFCQRFFCSLHSRERFETSFSSQCSRARANGSTAWCCSFLGRPAASGTCRIFPYIYRAGSIHSTYHQLYVRRLSLPLFWPLWISILSSSSF